MFLFELLVLKVHQVLVVELVHKVLLDQQESHQVLYCYGLVQQTQYHLVGYYVMVKIAHPI